MTKRFPFLFAAPTPRTHRRARPDRRRRCGRVSPSVPPAGVRPAPRAWRYALVVATV